MRQLIGIVACIVIVLPAAAETPGVASGPYTVTSDGLDAFDCFGEIYYEQPPNGLSGLSSQDDVCYPFVSEVVDDFLGAGSDLVGTGWWGVYWGGSPLPPDAFRIKIYPESVTGGVPGELVYEVTTTDYNETLGDPNGYCANFDPFTIADGQRYFVGFQAIFCFPPQWGESTGDGNGMQGLFKSEFFGWPDFVPNDEVFGVPYESAFLLYEDSVVPIHHGSWAFVKGLYR